MRDLTEALAASNEEVSTLDELRKKDRVQFHSLIVQLITMSEGYNSTRIQDVEDRLPNWSQLEVPNKSNEEIARFIGEMFSYLMDNASNLREEVEGNDEAAEAAALALERNRALLESVRHSKKPRNTPKPHDLPTPNRAPTPQRVMDNPTTTGNNASSKPPALATGNGGKSQVPKTDQGQKGPTSPKHGTPTSNGVKSPTPTKK